MTVLATRCHFCTCPPVCPHCGTDFAKLPRIVERDGWRISDRWAEYRDDGKIALTPAEASALRSIAASPGTVASNAIGSRAGFGEDPVNTARNLVSRLRSKIAGVPIVNEHGAGYRWEAGA